VDITSSESVIWANARRLSSPWTHTRVLGVPLHTNEPENRIVICDVGPRDGLQNEARSLEPSVRAELCNRLARAGLPRVEAVSLVNPVRVPQMAGAETVVAALERSGATVFAGLIVNERGYDRALACGVDEVHYAFPATDTFCDRNQGMTLAAAAELAGRLVERAHEDGMRITVTIGASFGCPFEGAVPPQRVFELAEGVQAHGPDEIVLADTIGVGVPSQVRELVAGVAALGATVGCHFHNTRNTGYANALAAVEAGVRLLDGSCGGTGGCPFAPRATGNIATEDLVYLLHGMGYETGVDLGEMLTTAAWLAEALGKELPGQTYKAGAFAPVAA
jgi:(R)-citramalyl-CoA lyase